MLNEKDLTRYLHLMFLMVYGGSIYSFDYTFGSAVFFSFLLKLILIFSKLPAKSNRIS